jgi:hypothetical protein
VNIPIPSDAGGLIRHRPSSIPTRKLCPLLRHALHKFCIWQTVRIQILNSSSILRFIGT